MLNELNCATRGASDNESGLAVERLVIITRRDYFAAAAMQGLLANSYADGRSQPLSCANAMEIAAMARDQADHMIKALEEE